MDLFEFADPSTGKSTPQEAASGSTAAAGPQPTLEEEVTQVFGQLGRFWGGFRKQSVTALESARKEVGQTVVSARGELGKLVTSPESTTIMRESSAAEDPTSSTHPSEEGAAAPASPSDKEKQPADPSSAPDGTAGTPTQPSFNAFLSRLQHSLPPQLAPESISQTFQTFQKQIQPTISNASTAASQAAAQASQAASQVDIQQFRTSFSTNIQRMQDAPLVAEYRKQGEALFKEAGEFLKDAVKVIPPDEQGATHMSWDGTDVWLYPSPVGTAGWGGSATVEESKPRRSGDTMTYARMKRADALLARLKHDPEMLKLNPAEDVAVKERYEKYVAEEIEQNGGLQGEMWVENIKLALAGGADGQALEATREKLVPSDLSVDEFWRRYFFRVHQIQDEEEKRKALLAATSQEEDFSWEDDDDESITSPKMVKVDLPTSASDALSAPKDTDTPSKTDNTTPVVEQAPMVASIATLSPPKDVAEAPASGPSSSAASPRESEESYDVLSAGIHSKDASSDDSDWE